MAPVKLPFADSDLAPLVKRYSSSTIVTMLREIAKCKTAKLDWGKLCKGTSTGITNPKELQALWRSVAYQTEMADSYDENNESPLEDDSDLEIELNPVPSISPAVAEGVSNYVKSDLQQQELEEARLKQNAVQTGVGHQAGELSTARGQQGSGLLDKPAATTTARRPSLVSATTQGESTATPTCSTSTKVPYSGAVSQVDRKRRRLWTPEEDLALISAVDKCGEGNWTTVLKKHSDFDRSASQLSQRWALIRKRREAQEKAGYGIGSGVSPLASGFKDLRPEGLKSDTLASGSGPQLGTLKDVGKAGNASMSIKQPLSSTSSVPVSKRVPAASASEATPASVLETQRVRALPASGVSSSWTGQRPQPHGQALGHQASMRAGASQVHKVAHAAEGVRRPAQGPSIGSPVFYTSTQTSTIPVDSKYAGVARGGGSNGGHGPDPMIQAAAMAAGARIAPASTAASLLKAAQSGNVVHIGSGGLPRSKLGLTSQAGSGNAGGNPGIVHYIHTGSGGVMAATSAGLQRTSSHNLAKNQTNRSFGSNSGSGNSSPLSVSTVPAQGARNNLQAPVQSSKPASLSNRGSSPQQKTASASNSTASTPSYNPPATTAATPTSTTPSSTSTPAPNSTSAANLTSTPAPKSMSIPTAVSASTLAPAPKSTSIATAVSNSTSAPAPKSASTPTPVSTSTSDSVPRSAPLQTSGSTSTLAPASKSTSTPTPVSTSPPAPAPAPPSTSAPSPTATATSAKAFKSISTSIPALASTSTSAPTPASTSKSPPAPPSLPVPASAPISIAAATPVSASTSTPESAPVAASISTPASASASVLTPVSASISTPASTPASTPVSARAPAPASAPVPAPSSKPSSTSVSIPVCGFNTSGPGIESPGAVSKGEFSQLLKNVTMSAKF